MRDDDFQANLGIDRRTLIKRGAVVGGTLVWATPVVQSLSAPAFATGSPLSDCQVETCRSSGTVGGGSTRTIRLYNADPRCCECIDGTGPCDGNPCDTKTQISVVTEAGTCAERA